jgi:hypothetical protein
MVIRVTNSKLATGMVHIERVGKFKVLLMGKLKDKG